MVQKEQNRLTHFIRLIVVSGILALSYSCTEEIERAAPIKKNGAIPVETAIEMTILYTDSGLIKAKIFAPVLERYDGKEPYMLMPKGVKMEFYDGAEIVSSTLTAKYAKVTEFPDNKIMEAKNQVVVVNENGETLNTESLFWNQKQERISTEAAVTITRKTEVIHGQGLESNQNFTKYKIKKINGIMEVEK